MNAQVWPPLHDTYQRSGRIMWQACCLGHEPAESLHWIDRQHLVSTLLGAGWRVPTIAGLTRMTCYTTARIARDAYNYRIARATRNQWLSYARCPRCRRVSGERCRDTRCSELVLLDVAHPERPLEFHGLDAAAAFGVTA